MYSLLIWYLQTLWRGFPGGARGKQPTNAGDVRDASWIPGSGRSPGGGHSNPFQYFCLENPIERGSQLATVHRVTKKQTWPQWLGIHALWSDHNNSTYLSPYIVTEFFSLVLRNFKIYSLSNFQISNTILLTTTVAALYIICQWLVNSIIWGLCLLTSFYQFTYPLPSASGNHLTVLCNYKLYCFLDPTHMSSYFFKRCLINSEF